MANIDFRQRAREALANAKGEMNAQSPQRLRFAALELRMAIEAVTYDRARSYLDELPTEVYRTWQPKKLMQQLLDLEPAADKDSSLAFGLEETPGAAASQMKHLGSELVFGMKAIKAHYDALGSFLHTPTLKQLEEQGDVDLPRLRERCSSIVEMLEQVLASKVFNINFGLFSSIECMNPDCKVPVRKRLQPGSDVTRADCRECGFEYKVQADGPDRFLWSPVLEEVACPTRECSEVFRVSRKELTPGRRLACSSCGGRFEIGLALFDASSPKNSSESKPTEVEGV